MRYVRSDVRRSRPLRRRESAMVACGHYDPTVGAFDASRLHMDVELAVFERGMFIDVLSEMKWNSNSDQREP